jgi:hypothetical protein
VATPVDISNLGLSHIGARAQVTAISPPDGSVEAGLCARFYPIARRELLESYGWSFAAKRVALSQVTNPSTAWAYAYAKPSDCIRPLRIPPLTLIDEQRDITLTIGAGTDTILTEAGTSRFTVEGDIIYTDEPDAVLIYVGDMVDSNKFSARFVVALGMMLASYLAGPIIKGDAGAKTSAQWRQAAMNYALSAAASDANGAADNDSFMPSHLAARA